MVRGPSVWVRLLAVFMLVVFAVSMATSAAAQSADDVGASATPEISDGTGGEDPGAGAEPTAEIVVEVTPEATEVGSPDPESSLAPGTPEALIEEPTAVDLEPGVDEAGLVGSMTLLVVDHLGNPVTGTCWDIGDQNAVPSFRYNVCDAADGADDGSVEVTFTGLSNGGNYAILSPNLPGYSPCDYIECQSYFSVPSFAGEIDTVVLYPLADVTVSKINEGGTLLPGSCFQLWAGSNPSYWQTVCDADDGSDDGTVRFLDVRNGSLQLTETVAPEGYILTPRRYIGQMLGSDIEVDVVNYPVSSLGSIRVSKVDENGDPLEDVCFDAYRADDPLQNEGGPSYGYFCTYDDDAQPVGDAVLNDIPAGDWVLYEWETPEGYGEPREPTLVTVVAGEETSITIENEAEATLTIRKLDSLGNLIPGVCFTVWPTAEIIGSPVADVCDEDDGAEDGIIEVLESGDQIVPGTFWIEEDEAPVGYQAPNGLTEVNLVSGHNVIEFENQKIVNLSVQKQDENGIVLTGSCFALAPIENWNEGIEVCDDDDGFNDGTIDFGDQVEGEYVLFESQAPEGYVAAFPLSLTLGPEDQVEIVRNTPLDEAATLIVEKVDEHGDPLAGACFELFEGGLTPDDAGPVSDVPAQEACDGDDGDEDGTIVFEAFPVVNGDSGSLVTLVETIVPDGYVGAGPFEVEVASGENVIEVENVPSDGTEPTATHPSKPKPTHTPDQDDEVTTLPSTGTGIGALGAGGVMLLILTAAIAIISGGLAHSSSRKPKA